MFRSLKLFCGVAKLVYATHHRTCGVWLLRWSLPGSNPGAAIVCALLQHRSRLAHLVDSRHLHNSSRNVGWGRAVIDDEDSKVRRNLVVFGSLVLLFAWLDLPSGVLLERLLGSERAPTVPPWKLWTVSMVMLMYLAMRYYSSDDHKGHLKAIDQDRRTGVERSLKKTIESNMLRVIEAGDESKSSLFAMTLHDQLHIAKGLPEELRRSITVEVSKFLQHPDPGWVAVNVHVGRHSQTSREQVRVGVRIGHRTKLYAKTRSIWRAWWNTKGGTAVFSVWLVALSAMFVVGWKLGGAVFAN